MESEFSAVNASDEEIDGILKDYKTVAVVGLSTNPDKDSYRVGAFLKNHGYRIIPVHPKAEEILDEKVFPSLNDIPDKVDVVCLFRPSEMVPPFVDQSIDIGARVVWMQLGIVNNEAADKARAAGLDVVMNKCMKIEVARNIA